MSLHIKEKIKNEFLQEEFGADPNELIVKEDFEVIADSSDLKIMQYTFFTVNHSEVCIHQYIYRKFENDIDGLIDHNKVLINRQDIRALNLN